MSHRFCRFLISMTGLLSLVANLALAQDFTGRFTSRSEDGLTILELQQTGNQITGSFSEESAPMRFNGTIESGRARGEAVLAGTPVRLFLSLWFEGAQLIGEITEEGEDGKPDQETAEKMVFVREGGPPASGGSGSEAPGKATTAPPAPPPSTLLDAQALQGIAGTVKANFQRESASQVLAEGNPPLTRESVRAFAELLRLAFAVELTEAEFAATSRHFIQYYQQGDAPTKEMLAGGWQNILAGILKTSGEERAKSVKEVHDVLEQRFSAGAQAGLPWAVAMNATIQRRQNTVARIEGSLPEYAQKSDLHQQMTEADLDASLEMLYFMWVACGRDASLVTPEAITQVRQLIVQNFPTFPPQVQYVFANAQKVYSSLRGQWAQATPEVRAQLAQSFAVSLDQLGLTVPSAGGDTIRAGGAWADMDGKSHGQWAAEMVQGLAGSSYKSSW